MFAWVHVFMYVSWETWQYPVTCQYLIAVGICSVSVETVICLNCPLPGNVEYRVSWCCFCPPMPLSVFTDRLRILCATVFGFLPFSEQTPLSSSLLQSWFNSYIKIFKWYFSYSTEMTQGYRYQFLLFFLSFLLFLFFFSITDFFLNHEQTRRYSF